MKLGPITFSAAWQTDTISTPSKNFLSQFNRGLGCPVVWVGVVQYFFFFLAVRSAATRLSDDLFIIFCLKCADFFGKIGQIKLAPALDRINCSIMDSQRSTNLFRKRNFDLAYSPDTWYGYGLSTTFCWTIVCNSGFRNTYQHLLTIKTSLRWLQDGHNPF
jgi:hypothetical protein